ncbi:hypothetical protein B7C42_00399 [Nocardia cerradoensis]|uniref:DUF3558 domain-containing protein n=1 Tax=Nocardia cerradoensis TaxID=85688 RepID=A0A231HF27_9NOCA|nr:DUF3558 domain-containing protein [Nocardia cerradoensis]OXR47277.1 hypothetical protein B7C42_00399 [Nocardia cerradoensis]
MVSWGKAARGIALGVGVVAVAAGCNSGGESKGNAADSSAKSTLAPDVPTGFDACKDVPQSILQTEHLKNPNPDVQDGAGGIKWRGCGWVQAGGDGYSVTIDTSNITLPMVRANKDFAVDKELTIAGRPALTSHVNGQDAQADCVINVEVKGGSLEISVENPPSARDTAGQHACDIAQRLAEGIIPAVPSSL